MILIEIFDFPVLDEGNENTLDVGGRSTRGEIIDVNDVVFASTHVDNIICEVIFLGGVFVDDFGHFAGEAFVPRGHRFGRLAVEHEADVGDDVERIVGRNEGGEARADTRCAIDENSRDNGNIVVGFDRDAVVVAVLEQRVVSGGEQVAGERSETGEDVTSRGVIFSAFVAGTELTIWDEQVDVVASDEILREADDCHVEGSLTVMIGSVLGDVSGKLLDFRRASQVSLKGTKQDLTL